MKYGIIALAWLAASAALAAEPGQVGMGRGIAERHCGSCHATGEGPSRLADAPPFRELYKRYPAGGLGALLAEGMLTPDPSLEEGVLPGHPRMPMVALGIDERNALTAYLRSLEPPRTAVAAPPGIDRDQGAAPPPVQDGVRRTIP
jgi:mono/diheme cytochrome c family protein